MSGCKYAFVASTATEVREILDKIVTCKSHKQRKKLGKKIEELLTQIEDEYESTLDRYNCHIDCTSEKGTESESDFENELQNNP